MQWFEVQTWLIELGLFILYTLFLSYYRYAVRKIEEEENDESILGRDMQRKHMERRTDSHVDD